jgi:hypothetical protein
METGSGLEDELNKKTVMRTTGFVSDAVSVSG